MSCYVSREVTTLVPILSQFKVQTPFPRHHTIVRAYRRLACSVRRLSLCLSNASRLRHHVCASGCFAVRSEAAVRCSNCVTGRRRRCCRAGRLHSSSSRRPVEALMKCRSLMRSRRAERAAARIIPPHRRTSTCSFTCARCARFGRIFPIDADARHSAVS